MVRTASLALILCSSSLIAGSGVRYVENKGQWPAPVLFKADAPGATIWVERGSVLIDRFQAPISHLHDEHAPRTGETDGGVVHHHAVRLRFLGATGPVKVDRELPSRDHFNFFIGDDRRRWASQCRAWSRITIRELYPGVDLVIHGSGPMLKYDLVVASAVDPSVIRFVYEGADGVELRDGNIIVSTSLGAMTESIPAAWIEQADGTKGPLTCRYAIDRNGTIGIQCGQALTGGRMTIDPTLEFSTFSGSTSDNFGYTATFDDLGFLYSGSSAFGQGYPTSTGAYDTSHNGGDGLGDGTDIAITKYDTTGSFLVWSTFIGGGNDDLPHSLVCNSDDEVFVLGSTSSTAFPTTVGAFDQSWNGGTGFSPTGLGVNYVNGSDMVIARLSADGSQLLASTYVGGSLNDGLNTGTVLRYNYADEIRGEILLDADDNVYVVSTTQSTDFPVTAGAYQTAMAGGGLDGIAFKLDPMLTTMAWSTFFGGTGADAAYAGELDDNLHLYISGGTASADLPITPGAVEGSYLGGSSDAFVGLIRNDGAALLNATYWGSSTYDQCYFVETDNVGDVYLFGQTAAASGQLVFGAAYNQPNGGQFISKLQPDLGAALWSSRFGNGSGAPNLSPTAFLVDHCRRIYIAGWGSDLAISGIPALSTAGMQVTTDAHQSTTDGHDFYIGVMDIDMTALYYATFFGGPVSREHVDGGTSRFDRRGRIYESVCAGCGGNDDFPSTPGAWSPDNNSSNCNNGVFKMDFDVPMVIAAAQAPDTVCAMAPIVFDNLSSGAVSYLWDFGDFSSSTAFEPTHTYASPGTYTVTLTATDPASCNFSDSIQFDVFIDLPGPVVQAMADTTICGPVASALLVANGSGTADQFIWSTSPLFTDTLNALLADSTTLLAPAMSGTYWVMALNASSCVAIDAVTITVSLADPDLVGDSLLCADDTATLVLSGIDPGSTIAWQPVDEVISGQGTVAITTAPDITTAYTVDVTSPAGCTWSGTITVQVSTISGTAVNASVDQTIVVAGTTVQLFGEPVSGVTWSWSPAGAVSDPGIANPTAVVEATTTFILTITDGVCTRSDAVTVTVHEFNCAEPDLFVPNAFTPNGDGNNDVLYVRGPNIASMLFRVFDRWGEKVFESRDRSSGWDGTYKDKPVDAAVFVWYLDAICVDGQTTLLKGNTTVIR